MQLVVGGDGVPWCPLYLCYKTHILLSKFTLKPHSAVPVEEGVSKQSTGTREVVGSPSSKVKWVEVEFRNLAMLG